VRLTRAIPDALRARAIGAAAGLQTAQEVAVLAAGALAEAAPPSAAIGWCGAPGSLDAALVGLGCRPQNAPAMPSTVEEPSAGTPSAGDRTGGTHAAG
jgi:hypothetical protein